MIYRRAFLGGLLAAPALVSSKSLMKVVAPERDIIVPDATLTIFIGGEQVLVRNYCVQSAGVDLVSKALWRLGEATHEMYFGADAVPFLK